MDGPVLSHPESLAALLIRHYFKPSITPGPHGQIKDEVVKLVPRRAEQRIRPFTFHAKTQAVDRRLMIKPDNLNRMFGSIGIRKERNHSLLVKAHNSEAYNFRSIRSVFTLADRRRLLRGRSRSRLLNSW